MSQDYNAQVIIGRNDDEIFINRFSMKRKKSNFPVAIFRRTRNEGSDDNNESFVSGLMRYCRL